MNVLPPRSLNPLQYGPGPSPDIERISRVPQQGEVWQIKVSDGKSKPVSPSSRESNSRVGQLENSIQFITKQHNDLLKSLYEEIESLKQRNRDLQFNSLTSGEGNASSRGAPIARAPGGAGSYISGAETQQVRDLTEEVEQLKSSLIHEREQNKKLQKLVDTYKRSVPLSSTGNDKRSGSSLSFSDTESSRLFVEEALPFSLKPFVVHPLDGPDRSPSLQECQAIIAQLSFHCQHQDTELRELKENLKDALYSQKWTPDAYLLAKAIVNDPSDYRPSSTDSKTKNGKSLKNIKIPESAYIHKEHGSLPALRQTLQPGSIERQKKMNSLQKKRSKNYTLTHNLEPLPPPAGASGCRGSGAM